LRFFGTDLLTFVDSSVTDIDKRVEVRGGNMGELLPKRSFRMIEKIRLTKKTSNLSQG